MTNSYIHIDQIIKRTTNLLHLQSHPPTPTPNKQNTPTTTQPPTCNPSPSLTPSPAPNHHITSSPRVHTHNVVIYLRIHINYNTHVKTHITNNITNRTTHNEYAKINRWKLLSSLIATNTSRGQS